MCVGERERERERGRKRDREGASSKAPASACRGSRVQYSEINVAANTAAVYALLPSLCLRRDDEKERMRERERKRESESEIERERGIESASESTTWHFVPTLPPNIM